MSLNSKISESNGIFLTRSKMRKANEPVRGSSNGCIWKRLHLFLWVFVTVFGFGLFLFNGVFMKKMEVIKILDDKSLVLVEQFNVSKELFHEPTSSFFESDQITSLKCTKQLGDDMSTKHKFTCAVKMLNNAQNVELWGQCPIHDDKAVQTMLLGEFERVHNNSILKPCIWVLIIIALCTLIPCVWKNCKGRMKRKEHAQSSSRGAGKWMKTLLVLFVLLGVTVSICLFWYLYDGIQIKRKETLANMCDERARMLQDQFNVSMNHVHALAILVSTFYHGKQPPAMDQKTFGEYTERTAFERPLTSGVAYALRVRHSDREKFEKEHGWTIKKMETEDQDQTLAQDCDPENLDPSPIQDEYAPVILSQETVSHIVSIDMMSGKEDRENILRARASGKGVLTSPFMLLKSNHLGVVLTFAVYNAHLHRNATPEQRIKATVGYLGASYDVPSLVEKLLHQLASKQTIVVNVYDTTNVSAAINMYGPSSSLSIRFPESKSL